LALTAKLYGPLFENLKAGAIGDLSVIGTVVKCALLADTYTFDQAHDNWNQISTHEIADADYAAQTLASKTVTFDSVGKRATTFDAANVSFGSEVTISARYAVLYDDTPAAAADKKLFVCIDFDEQKSSTSAKFEINWNANGIFRTTVAA
jgi:hypothetical protein